jgi:hypothetical protein
MKYWNMSKVSQINFVDGVKHQLKTFIMYLKGLNSL